MVFGEMKFAIIYYDGNQNRVKFWICGDGDGPFGKKSTDVGLTDSDDILAFIEVVNVEVMIVIDDQEVSMVTPS